MTLDTTEPVARSRDERAQNLCLAALSADAFALLEPNLNKLVLAPGAVLWEPGQPQQQTYFPASGLMSITLPMQDGTAIEVGTVGYEGATVGANCATEHQATTRALVLVGGTFMQIATGTLAELAQQSREIDDMLRCCSDWLLAQAQQLAACNAAHPADQRLCRWLALAQHRMDGGRIFATQELIGTHLGIRRTTVTLLAHKLQEQGLIDYSRGRISIRDAARLEAAACGCCANLGRSRWPATRLAAMKAEAVDYSR